MARARGLALHSSRILRHECLGIEALRVLKHVVLDSVVQNNVAEADITKALGAILSKQGGATTVHEPHMRAHWLIERCIAAMVLLTLIYAHHLLVRVLLRVHASLLSGLLLQLEVLSLYELILHRQFVLLTHASMGTEVLHCILDIPRFLEAIRGRYLIIKVYLLLIKDEYIASCHHIPLHINQVTAPIHQSSILIIQFSIGRLQNNEIQILVCLKFTQNLFNVEIWQFRHTPPRESLSLPLGLSCAGHFRLGFGRQLRVTILVIFGVRIRTTSL